VRNTQNVKNQEYPINVSRTKQNSVKKEAIRLLEELDDQGQTSRVPKDAVLYHRFSEQDNWQAAKSQKEKVT